MDNNFTSMKFIKIELIMMKLIQNLPLQKIIKK